MHYLHLVIVNADSHESACEEASSIVSQFGNENNWSVACGSVSKDTGKIYSTGEGRFDPSEILKEEINSVNFMKGKNKKQTTLSALENLYQSFKGDVEVSEDHKKQFTKTLKDLLENKPVDGFNIYSLKSFLEKKYELSSISKEDDSVWASNFYFAQYDQCGVSNHTEYGESQYCVFIDMHS
jgi:hypothetical protein